MGSKTGLAALHNYIKTELLRESRWLSNGLVLYDTTVGMGGDIHKWVNNGFTRVFASDISLDSLEECMHRYSKKKENENVDLELQIKQSDLRTQTPFTNLGASVVTCFFSIHYFFGRPADLKNFFRCVHFNIGPSGIFVVTFLNGDLMHQQFSKSGDRLYNTVMTANRKYRDYRPYGSRITFKIESTYFKSKGTSSEFLVSPGIVENVAKEYHLEVVRQGSFKDYFEKGPMASPQELQVSYLHHYMIFRNTHIVSDPVTNVKE